MPNYPIYQLHIRHLDRLAPTSFGDLKTCRLKLVLGRSGNQELLPKSPKSQLGTIIHLLIAEAGEGKLTPDASVLEKRWLELVEKANEKMGRSDLYQHLVPLQEKVRDYEVKKTQAIGRALNLAGNARGYVQSDDSTRKYGYEVAVESSGGEVKGYIDFVASNEAGPLIKDFKSGAILESNDLNEMQVKESYRDQLMIYAALYAEQFGDWASILEVVPISGEAYAITFEKEDCVRILDQSKAGLNSVNQIIADNDAEDIPRLLANPKPEHCKFCAYRPGCEPYWANATTPAEEGWPADVRGVIEKIVHLGNSTILLSVRTDNGIVNIPGLTPENRHPELGKMDIGDTIGIFGLRRNRRNDSYLEGDFTTILRYSEQQ